MIDVWSTFASSWATINELYQTGEYFANIICYFLYKKSSILVVEPHIEKFTATRLSVSEFVMIDAELLRAT